jgi:para-aminobenzoate synthetase / 4-amino-4-deoxychorismate lyase
MTPATRVILHDASAGAWQLFANPCEIVRTFRHGEVMGCLRHIERMVESRGLHAAGFVSYEAAPDFDPALLVRPSTDFPLLWFGLFPRAEAFDFPPLEHAPPKPAPPWQPSITAQQYAASIAELRDAIARGETYQVNFTFRLKQTASRNPWDVFAGLVAAQQPSYAAFVETPQYVVCSASPELFFELHGNRIVSRPMKGTIARGRWYEEDLARASDLAASEKNRAENAMIVDMMRNDLGRIARTGSVRVTDLFRVERYPTLWQMTSCVSAETSAGLAEIFAAMFPCASITGAPKPSTMRIIAHLETEPRRVYTGSIGRISPGRQAQFNVAIRTVLFDKALGEAEYGVGGGVVWDSTSQDEYEECLLKARILDTVFPEFSLLETILWTPSEGYAFLDEHLHRLRQSAEYFAFPQCVEAARRLAALADRLPPVPHKIRLLAARDGTISCEHEPIVPGEFPDPVRLKLAAAPIDSADVFLYHKTTHRAAYAAAKTGCGEADDVLLYNQRGEITETLRGNIVIRQGEQLWTPPVSCGLLPGTHRARLLAEGTIRERAIPLEMLPDCDELFFINSVRLWRKALLSAPLDVQSIAAGSGVKVR